MIRTFALLRIKKGDKFNPLESILVSRDHPEEPIEFVVNGWTFEGLICGRYQYRKDGEPVTGSVVIPPDRFKLIMSRPPKPE